MRLSLQTDYALRQWFAQRKEGKVVSFGEMVIRLGYMTPRLLEPYVHGRRASSVSDVEPGPPPAPEIVRATQDARR